MPLHPRSAALFTFLACGVLACGDGPSTSVESEADAGPGDVGVEDEPPSPMPDAEAMPLRDDCEGEQTEGVCLPVAPDLMAAECPSGAVGDGGLCQIERPRLSDWVCPEGWGASPAFTGDAVPEDAPPFDYCRPPEVPSTCPAGSRPAPGGCVEMGGACPPEGVRWFDEATIKGRAAGFDGRVWYVDPVAVGGDGGRETPLRTISQAVGAAEEGDIVALSVGVLPQGGVIDRRVALVGACVSGTRVTGLESSRRPWTLEFDGARGALVTHLSLQGRLQGIGVDGGEVEISSVAIEGLAGTGIRVSGGAQARISNVLVGDTETTGQVACAGCGVVVAGGAQVEIDGASILRSEGQGVRVEGEGTVATVTRILVADSEDSRGEVGTGQGMVALGGAVVSVRGGVFVRNRTHGIEARDDGTEVSLEGIYVGGTRSRAVDQRFGRGVVVMHGAALTGERLVVEGNLGVGISAEFGAEIDVRDSVVLDMLPEEGSRLDGWGVYVSEGSRVALERVVVSRAREYAIRIIDEGTTAVLSDVVMTETFPEAETNNRGHGLVILRGARLEGARLVACRNLGGTGFWASGAGTEAVLEDLRVSSGEVALENVSGGAVLLTEASRLSLVRAEILSNVGLGFVAAEEGTEASLESVYIDDTRSRGDGSFGWGLVVSNAVVEAREVIVRRSTDTGIAVVNDGVLSIEDVVVEDTRPRGSSGRFGLGVTVSFGGVCNMRRAIVQRNRFANALVADGELNMVDVQILDGLSQGGSGEGGMGVLAMLRGRLSIERGLMARNRFVSLLAQNARTTVDLRDLVVRDTFPADCGEGCEDFSGGMGISVLEQAEGRLTHFLIVENETVGLQLARGATLAASRGLITRNTIGFNVQAESFEVDSIFDEVRLFDNGVDLDTSTLPVPSATTGIAALVGLD